MHLLFALDTLQTILTIDDLFFWFVYNFGDTEKVLQFHWAFDIPTLDAIVGFLVQIVYCWRIWVLSGWRVIPAISVLVSLRLTLVYYGEHTQRPWAQISLVATGAGFAAGIRVGSLPLPWRLTTAQSIFLTVSAPEGTGDQQRNSSSDTGMYARTRTIHSTSDKRVAALVVR